MVGPTRKSSGSVPAVFDAEKLRVKCDLVTERFKMHKISCLCFIAVVWVIEI